jgi:hypothetical protein
MAAKDIAFLQLTFIIYLIFVLVLPSVEQTDEMKDSDFHSWVCSLNFNSGDSQYYFSLATMMIKKR